MNIFGIGLPEMAVIMVVALLIFGPKKLPEIGRSLGKTIKSFQDASKEFENEFKREAERVEQDDKPMEARLETPKALAQTVNEPIDATNDQPIAEVIEPVSQSQQG